MSLPSILAVPFAGGSAYAFARLEDTLTGQVSICPVDLPGHGRRMHEPLPASIEQMAQDILETYPAQFTKPCTLLGHSMGALVVHALANCIRQKGLPAPQRLILSSCGAPGTHGSLSFLTDLPRDAFWTHMAQLGGVPQEALKATELLDLFEPIVKNDLRAILAYQPPSAPPLDLPVTVVAGTNDSVPAESLNAWEAFSSWPLDLRRIPGGHFHLLDNPEAIASILVEPC